MSKHLLALLIGVCATGPVAAQSIAVFTVDQPAQFAVDAGFDQDYSGTPLILGGQPTATGGGSNYAFVWVPTDGLDDPNAANPVLDALIASTLYTVTVTDLLTGCIKVSETQVDLDPTLGLSDIDRVGLRIFPNPANTTVWIQAEEVPEAIELRSMSGQQVLLASYPAANSTALDIGSLSNGMYFLTITLTNGRTITHKLCKASCDL